MDKFKEFLKNPEVKKNIFTILFGVAVAGVASLLTGLNDTTKMVIMFLGAIISFGGAQGLIKHLPKP